MTWSALPKYVGFRLRDRQSLSLGSLQRLILELWKHLSLYVNSVEILGSFERVTYCHKLPTSLCEIQHLPIRIPSL